MGDEKKEDRRRVRIFKSRKSEGYDRKSHLTCTFLVRIWAGKGSGIMRLIALTSVLAQ